MNSAGELVLPGTYQVTAIAKTLEGEEQLTTSIALNVDSVTLDASGEVELNVEGFGPLALEEVKQIR